MPQFNAVYFVSEPPEIFIENGLVHISFGINGYQPEFVMQPSVYLAARRVGQRVVEEFHAGKRNVLAFTDDSKADSGQGHG